MAIKYQFNKTSLQALEKNLKMRQRTLPIIKSKETALRLEVKKCKDEAEVLEERLQQGLYVIMFKLSVFYYASFARASLMRRIASTIFSSLVA